MSERNENFAMTINLAKIGVGDKIDIGGIYTLEVVAKMKNHKKAGHSIKVKCYLIKPT